MAHEVQRVISRGRLKFPQNWCYTGLKSSSTRGDVSLQYVLVHVPLYFLMWTYCDFVPATCRCKTSLQHVLECPFACRHLLKTVLYWWSCRLPHAPPNFCCFFQHEVSRFCSLSSQLREMSEFIGNLCWLALSVSSWRPVSKKGEPPSHWKDEYMYGFLFQSSQSSLSC